MQTPDQPSQPCAADDRSIESRSRPRIATIALVVYGLYIASRIYRLQFPLEQFKAGEISGLGLLLPVSAVGFLIAIGILLANRVGWARWVLAAIAAWQIYDLNWGIRALQDLEDRMYIGPTDIAMWLWPVVCSLAAAILVFGPARRWFRRGAR